MGGFVMTQLYGFSRSTVDIDALAIDPRTLAGKIQDLAAKSGLFILNTKFISTS
jgi:hypothetical protein